MRILVGCNLLANVNTVAYPNHMQFWYQMGKRMPDVEILFYSPRRMGIDRMRNEAAKIALAQECDYLFFYDDDVLLPDDCLQVLLEHKKPVAAGMTYVRSYPYPPMAFKYVRKGDLYTMTSYKDYKKHTDEKGILVCDAVGFSCCLLDCKQLKKLHSPYFVTGPDSTEDVYYCHKINTELDLVDPIIIDTNIVTGHLLDSYYISPGNKQHFIRLEKGLANQFGGKFEPRKREDRDADYREQVLERVRKASAQA